VRAKISCALVALATLASAAFAAGPVSIILATTTSTQDTGLLDVLVPAFEGSHPGITLKTVAVGTGEALAMGRRGDADVLLVHHRASEDAFMAEGFGSLRLDVMHNFFELVGPAADPAAAKGQKFPESFARIAAKGATFVSRGDQSGTHKKELELWKQVGITPAGKPWYVEAGQGMGATAQIASEKRAYTLIDRGTYLALKATLDLVVIGGADAALRNSYGVIVVNPAKCSRCHPKEAELFARWLVSPATQRLIGEFGKAKLGEPLFIPDALGTPAK
jgi:tungstate transport system substrate-binding protein